MKKGFTLVELLAVIALLSIIILIAVPSITKLRQSAVEKERENQIKEIESAAVFYVQDEIIEISEDTTISVTVKMLIDTGYVKANVESGKTNCSSDNSNGCLFDLNGNNLNSKEVKISKINNKLVAKYQE